MKKSLLLIVFLLVSQLNSLFAQSLIVGPDTVCVNQPVQLSTTDDTAHSYYWGFCSGYLMNAPIGTNLGDHFNFHYPGNIDIIQENGQYYGFVVNSSTREFMRLNFGNSLANSPTVTNFGNMTNGIPFEPTSLYIVQDPVSKFWFIFISGGYTAANSTLARVDFGAHLSNPAPNVANFGNHTGLLNGPKGFFVAQNPDGHWYGYLVNHNTSELIRMDFSFNISNTPLMEDLLNPNGVLQVPTDMAAVQDNGNWYLFVTNSGNNSVARIDLGSGLDPLAAVVSTAGNTIADNQTPPDRTFNNRIIVPSAITITRDCGSLYAYVTDSTTNQLIGIQMSTVTGPYVAVDYNVVGAMNHPSSISSIMRSGDNLYGFITNAKDSTLTRIEFDQCHQSTIPSFSEVNPPAYSYDTQGVYNVYLVINDGRPDMQVACRPITVLAPPPLNKTPDAVICQGDTIRLWAVSNLADSIKWTTTYNLDTTYLYQDSAKAYPYHSTSYNIVLYYPFGCIVDTAINIGVLQVKADAGPDRYIPDGSTTMLGGPNSSIGTAVLMPPYTQMNTTFTYHWWPYQYMSDSTLSNPTVNPPYDFTYYLTVSVTGEGGLLTCSSTDTVVVHLKCGDFNLPNAFAPASSNPGVNTFGLLNSQIVKLNYLRVYNRWGVLVFETTDPTQKWDGSYNGSAADEGVYVWIADGFCASGKEVKKSGNVTLLR